MKHFKTRILAVILMVVSVVLVYYNWQHLLHQREYSTKMAAFAPLVGIGGLFLLLFPAMIGKPETGREKFIVMIVFVIGLVAGLYNWYLMDPGFFGR
jgi:uncharacterized membrane protein